MAAVLYNDSCYIAHNCTLITHTYKNDLGKIDSSLHHNSGFIDFIPKFRYLSSFLSVSVSLFLSLSSVSVVCVGVCVCVCVYLSSLLSCNPEHNASDSLSVRDVYFALISVSS